MKHTLRRLIVQLWLVTLITFAIPVAAVQEVVLIIDNSGSMRKNDPHSLTKQAVARFIQNTSLDTQMALMIFDKEAKILFHLTPVDENVRLDLLANLNRINFKGPLTNSGDALALGIEELQNHGQPAGKKYIVFLTDGIVDTGDTARDLQMAEKIRGELATKAAEAGIRIFAIAFTDNADKKLMEGLAATTRGAFFQPLKPEDLPGVFAQINESFTAEQGPSGTGPEAKAPEQVSTEPQAEAVPEVQSPATPEGSETPDKDLKARPSVSEIPSPPLPGGAEGSLATPEASTAMRAYQPPLKEMSEAPNPEPSSRWMNLIVISTVGLALLLSGASLIIMYRMSETSKQEQSPLRNAQDDAPKALLYVGSRKKPLHSAQTDVYDLTSKTTLIGRAPGTGGIVIQDSGISRQHAVIEYRDYTYWVIDQGSANGTFVNDERIASVRRLNHGDRLRFHKTEFLFLMPGRDDAERTMILPLEGTLSQATKA